MTRIASSGSRTESTRISRPTLPIIATSWIGDTHSCSISGQRTSKVDWSVLSSPDDLELIKPLAEYPALVEASAQALEPHRLTYYLQELAARLHAYYYKHRILPPALEQELDNKDNLKASAQETDRERKRETLTPALTAARLCLFRNVQSVIRNGLGILGVSAPERM